MNQLSAMDAVNVYLDRRQAPANGGLPMVYDRSTAPGGEFTFEDLLDHFEVRLHLMNTFRQRLKRVPGDLDHPWWVEDNHFDLEYHVRNIALPKPGSWHQLRRQVARLHARPLEMRRPPWELYMIDGLDGAEGFPEGSFALALKVHHAAMDAKTMMAVHGVLPSPSRTVADPPPPKTLPEPEPEPSSLWLLRTAGAHAMKSPLTSVKAVGALAPGFVRAIRDHELPLGIDSIAPVTRFNGPVSAHRVLDGIFYPLDQLKPIRAAVDGATIHDVALAVYGGALRYYLGERGELPTRPLRAASPVAVRRRPTTVTSATI